MAWEPSLLALESDCLESLNHAPSNFILGQPHVQGAEGDIIEKGFVPVTDRPGLGVEMNEEAARKVQVKGTPWFEEGM